MGIISKNNLIIIDYIDCW